MYNDNKNNKITVSFSNNSNNVNNVGLRFIVFDRQSLISLGIESN